jgi:hypothetical protein
LKMRNVPDPFSESFGQFQKNSFRKK